MSTWNWFIENGIRIDKRRDMIKSEMRKDREQGRDISFWIISNWDVGILPFAENTFLSTILGKNRNRLRSSQRIDDYFTDTIGRNVLISFGDQVYVLGKDLALEFELKSKTTDSKTKVIPYSQSIRDFSRHGANHIETSAQEVEFRYHTLFLDYRGYIERHDMEFGNRDLVPNYMQHPKGVFLTQNDFKLCLDDILR